MGVAGEWRAGTVTHVSRGFTLIETLVAVALAGVGVAGVLLTMGAFARFSTHQAGPVRSAAMLLAEQTLRIAQDAWKYGSPGTAPSGSWQTNVPLNFPGVGSTSAPVTVSANVAAAGAQAAQITVTVRYTPDPQHAGDSGSVTMSGELAVKAPFPGTTVVNPSLIPQPSGAP